MSEAVFFAEIEIALKIECYLTVASQKKVQLSYIGKLWKSQPERMFVIFSLLEHQTGKKSVMETFNKIRDRALSAGLVSKLTNLRDGKLMFRLYLLKAYLEDEDPFDGDTSDDEVTEDEEFSGEEAEEFFGAENEGVDEPDYPHWSTDV